MEKIRLTPVLVVEGKYDAVKLGELVDGLILTTQGFSIFTDSEKQQLIRRLGRRRGLLILTDSDAAGFRIRRFLNDIAQGLPVKNLYIPGIAGKERRKSHPGKEGLLGVEGMDATLLRRLLREADVTPAAPRSGRAVSYADLYEWGLSGTAGAADKRRLLLEQLGLPQRLSKKALLEVIGSLYTYEEFVQVVQRALTAPAAPAAPGTETPPGDMPAEKNPAPAAAPPAQQT